MYNPKVNPLSEELAAKVAGVDWSKIAPALIGFDIYVDIDGYVGFYEGNSCPFATGDYRSSYGSDLDEAIARELERCGNVVGINIDPNEPNKGSRGWNAGVARSIAKNAGLEVVMLNEKKTRWDGGPGKFYFEDGGRRYVDVLFNRCPGAQTNLRKRVPQRLWDTAPVISPIAHTLILANKDRTRRALKRWGLDMPLAFVATNAQERQAAMEEIMWHIREQHPNYEPPYILIKPVAGTGARKIRVFEDETSRPSRPIQYPCLVGERITASPNNGHMADTRMFYAGGHATHGIVRTAAIATADARVQTGKGFKVNAFVTNLCRGGHAGKWNPEAEKLVQQYALAAALAIDEAAGMYTKGEFE
jgi:hypothetical protein